MTIDELLDEFEKDTEFLVDLGEDTRRIPRLHGKYYRRYIKAKRRERTINEEMDLLKSVKRNYYSGKAPASVYKENPFDYNLTKTEVETWIKTDPDVIALNKKLSSIREFVEILTECVSQINKRNFFIKSILDSRKFQSGEN